MSVQLTLSSKLLRIFLLFLMVFLFLLLAKPAFAFTPNDPYFIDQWHLGRINMSRAWDIVGNSSSVTIAIIDSGVDIAHPDLIGNLWTNTNEVPGDNLDNDNNGYIDDIHGWNFTNNNNNPQDTDGHGTAVAGVVAAATNNALGVAGVSFNSKIMVLKVSTSLQISDAIKYAVDNGAKVISASFLIAATGPLEIGVAYAQLHNVLIVAAAGNNNSDSPLYPAAYSITYNNVISVGGTTTDDTKLPESNYGYWVDVAAPAINILTTRANLPTTTGSCSAYSDTNYATCYLTSYSAPQAAGLAALLIVQDSTRTPSAVRDLIRNSADPVPGTGLGLGTYWQYGRINACKAVGGTNCDITSGLIGNWKMNEAAWNGTAGEVKDASGNNNGTALYGSAIAGGSGGNNVGGLDGVNDRVNVPITNMSRFNLTDLTMSAWVRRGATSNYGSIVAKTKIGSPILGWDLDLGICQSGVGNCSTNNNNLFFQATGLNISFSTGTITDTNNWHHVAVTKQGSTVTFYIDGQPSGTTSRPGVLANNLNEIQIGTDNSHTYNSRAFFNGLTDDVRIYNRALAGTEVTTLYNQTTPPAAPFLPNDSLLGRWKMDETSGITVADSSTNAITGTAKDYKPNNADGNTPPPIVVGMIGNARKFDGTDDYINSLIPDTTIFQYLREITLSAWIKRTDFTNYGSIIAKVDLSNLVLGRDFNLGICKSGIEDCSTNNDKLFFRGTSFSPATIFSTGTIPNTTSWHHVAVTKQDSTVTFYINGQPAGTTTQSGFLYNNQNQIQIGTHTTPAVNPAAFFKGRIDDVRIFNRALTSTEISQIYDLAW